MMLLLTVRARLLELRESIEVEFLNPGFLSVFAEGRRFGGDLHLIAICDQHRHRHIAFRRRREASQLLGTALELVACRRIVDSVRNGERGDFLAFLFQTGFRITGLLLLVHNVIRSGWFGEELVETAALLGLFRDSLPGL